jgi:hypothetical protein
VSRSYNSCEVNSHDSEFILFASIWVVCGENGQEVGFGWIGCCWCSDIECKHFFGEGMGEGIGVVEGLAAVVMWACYEDGKGVMPWGGGGGGAGND